MQKSYVSATVEPGIKGKFGTSPRFDNSVQLQVQSEVNGQGSGVGD